MMSLSFQAVFQILYRKSFVYKIQFIKNNQRRENGAHAFLFWNFEDVAQLYYFYHINIGPLILFKSEKLAI